MFTEKPDNPKSIKVTCDVTSASMQWEASFNGGDQQSFIILAFNGQHGTTISEKINETGKNVYIHGVQNLQPSTLYEFYVSAQNRHGNSSSEKISCTTLEGNLLNSCIFFHHISINNSHYLSIPTITIDIVITYYVVLNL